MAKKAPKIGVSMRNVCARLAALEAEVADLKGPKKTPKKPDAPTPKDPKNA